MCVCVCVCVLWYLQLKWFCYICHNYPKKFQFLAYCIKALEMVLVCKDIRILNFLQLTKTHWLLSSFICRSTPHLLYVKTCIHTSLCVYRVASHSESNKMPTASLAKVFGLTIVGFACANPEPSDMWKDTQLQPKVIY